jgi:hypothetical protein
MTKGMRITPILVGCIFFGVAMACRDHFDSVWIRAAIAAVGGVTLVLAITLANRRATP